MKKADCGLRSRRIARWSIHMSEQYTKDLIRRCPEMRQQVTTRFKHRIARERRALASLGVNRV